MRVVGRGEFELNTLYLGLFVDYRNIIFDLMLSSQPLVADNCGVFLIWNLCVCVNAAI